MDLKRVKNLRLLLTGHFAVIAWLTAMLVASGSGSVFLPGLIFFCSLSAFVFVDLLERFELKSFTSAFAMTLATGIAVGQYVVSVFNDSEPGQLMAVAGLLIYPEAVLFMQRKNLRVFEQLAVFLLLEMIVAALVNDNIFFGLMLAPIILLWVSSLFLFSRYATLVKIDSSIEVQHPKIAEVLFRRFMKSVIGENKKQPKVASTFVASQEVQSSRTFRRLLQSFPIGVGALAFAGLFFYLVPRVNSTNFGSAFGTKSTIGLPERLTFGNVGRMLQNPAPVMRVTFKDRLSLRHFQPKSPPYLRARLFDQYGTARGTRKGEWTFTGSLNPRKLGFPRFLPNSYSAPFRPQHVDTPATGEADEAQQMASLQDLGRDLILVEFKLRPEFASEMFTIPPVFATPKRQQINLHYDDRFMLLQRLDNMGLEQTRSVNYEVLSAGFQGQTQVAATPAVLSYTPRRSALVYEVIKNSHTAGFEEFTQAEKYRQEFLTRNAVNPENKLAIAQAIERNLAFSGEFSYTLDLRPLADTDLDPVEDFLVNQKMGHCQYFATAMVCLLRQSDIPSRLVIGYRPTEFNALGGYFTVRQNDAHAWVEALFSREQLEGSIFESELTSSDYFWVRFDPTPPPDGELEITQQNSQAMDLAEKLWQEYVVEGQNLASDSGIYAPVSESDDTYRGMVERFKAMLRDLRSGALFGEVGFAWPVTILIIVVGSLALLVWQVVLLLPRFAPNWARRFGIIKTDLDLNHPFYSKCMRTLSQLGIRRAPAETPAEFTADANQILRKHGQNAEEPVGFLTALYYRLRFGKDAVLSAEEQAEISQQLTQVETAVKAANRNR